MANFINELWRDIYYFVGFIQKLIAIWPSEPQLFSLVNDKSEKTQFRCQPE